jgi:hypothetical protein
MDTAVQALRIENLEARIGLRQFVCASLEIQIDAAGTAEEKAALISQRDEALKAYFVLRLALDLLRRSQESGSNSRPSSDRSQSACNIAQNDAPKARRSVPKAR